jgi:hypothetical protein
VAPPSIHFTFDRGYYLVLRDVLGRCFLAQPKVGGYGTEDTLGFVLVRKVGPHDLTGSDGLRLRHGKGCFSAQLTRSRGHTKVSRLVRENLEGRQTGGGLWSTEEPFYRQPHDEQSKVLLYIVNESLTWVGIK